MSIVWDGTAGDRASTTSVGSLSIASSCAVSACGWVTGNSQQRSPFGFAGGTTAQYDLLRRAASNTLNVFGYSTGPKYTEGGIEGLTLPSDANEWWFWAFNISGTAIGSSTLRVWTSSGGWQTSSNTEALQAVAIDKITFGGAPILNVESWVGKTFAVKVWNAVLTADEFERERKSVAPKRSENLHSFVACVGKDSATSLYDPCGNSWTLSGTPGSYSATHPLEVSGGVPAFFGMGQVVTAAETAYTGTGGIGLAGSATVQVDLATVKVSWVGFRTSAVHSWNTKAGSVGSAEIVRRPRRAKIFT